MGWAGLGEGSLIWFKNEILNSFKNYYHIAVHINSWSTVKQHFETSSSSRRCREVIQHRGGYTHYWSHRGQWIATDLSWQWSEMTNGSVRNSLSSCVQVFFKTELVWWKLFLYMIKRMKVRFQLISLPDDNILINHVTDNLHIQYNKWIMLNCWFPKINCHCWLLL